MRRIRAFLLVLPLLLPSVGRAESGPIPPCGVSPEPSYPSVGAEPKVAVWRPASLGATWVTPDCAGWTFSQSTMLMALSGSFRFEGTTDDLLAAFGAISTLEGVQYWSVTDHRWRALITNAAAVRGPDIGQRRPDFTVVEMMRGGDLYFTQSDSRSSGRVTYRMRVREAAPGRIVIGVENVSSVRLLLIPIYEPGDLKATYFLTRIAGSIWGYYDLSGVREGFLGFTVGHDASYINRATALFRHVAGVPTDQEPPVAH